MQFGHFLNKCVRDRVLHRIALNVLRVELLENGELMLDKLVSLNFLQLGRSEHTFRFFLPFLGLKGGLAEDGSQDRVPVRSNHHLVGSLLSHLDAPLLLLSDAFLALGQLKLLLLLPAIFQLVFSLLLDLLLIETVFLLFLLTLASLLSLLLLEVADQALPGDSLALEAFPDAVWHSVQICAEQMIGLLTAAAVDEISLILAFEAVVGVLDHLNRLDNLGNFI